MCVLFSYENVFKAKLLETFRLYLHNNNKEKTQKQEKRSSYGNVGLNAFFLHFSNWNELLELTAKCELGMRKSVRAPRRVSPFSYSIRKH